MSDAKLNESKLKKFEIPIIILFIVVVLFLVLQNKKPATQTFAPSDTYQDGKYIAGISLSDAEMDLIVEVTGSKITSVSLDGLDEKTSALYKDLAYGIDYVNTYVTATQSLELPQNTNSSAATNMLMDAVKVALSDDENAQISSTYEKSNLADTEAIKNAESDALGLKAPSEQEDANSEGSAHTKIIEEEVIEQ